MDNWYKPFSAWKTSGARAVVVFDSRRNPLKRRAMGPGARRKMLAAKATLAAAAEEHGVEFPLLFDADVKHVNAMGLRNTQYEPGQRPYGIPYPGIFLIDAQGVIRAKFAEEDYKLRPEFSLVMEEAKKL